jgi:hypothetical protein
MNQIDQIVETLDKRGESDAYIVEYLRDIIKGLQVVAPKQVNNYLDITIQNQQH